MGETTGAEAKVDPEDEDRRPSVLALPPVGVAMDLPLMLEETVSYRRV